MKNVLNTIALGLMLAALAACSAPSTPIPPTAPPFSLPTLIPSTPTPIPTAIPTPTLLPATATLQPTNTTAATLVATLPTIPQTATSTLTPTAAPSPTPAIPPGLYVTSMRIDPDPPLRGPDLKFVPSFTNSLGRTQNFRWIVYVYREDNLTRSIGETTRTDTPIEVGNSELVSSGSWKLPLGGPCDFFFAQVGWFNNENKVVWFTTPTGQLFQKHFTVCPPQ